jgi:hypothetical protein
MLVRSTAWNGTTAETVLNGFPFALQPGQQSSSGGSSKVGCGPLSGFVVRFQSYYDLSSSMSLFKIADSFRRIESAHLRLAVAIIRGQKSEVGDQKSVGRSDQVPRSDCNLQPRAAVAASLGIEFQSASTPMGTQPHRGCVLFHPTNPNVAAEPATLDWRSKPLRGISPAMHRAAFLSIMEHF